MIASRIVNQQISVLKDQGVVFRPGMRVLDLGCGNGNIVWQYRQLGFEGYGCDLTFKDGEHVTELSMKGWIRPVDLADYQLPFEDGFFDIVLTNQVMEHVQDYTGTLAEIYRVMKPGSWALHIFPPRYRLIEAHVKVPFAGVIQRYWWLALWAWLGIRNDNQKGLGVRVTAIQNHEYLLKHTNYFNRRQLTSFFTQYFLEVRFCEKSYLATTERGKRFPVLSWIFSPLAPLYSMVRMRVVLCGK